MLTWPALLLQAANRLRGRIFLLASPYRLDADSWPLYAFLPFLYDEAAAKIRKQNYLAEGV